MGPNDFDTVTTIAAERNDIGIFLSSTPTGKRGDFYECCTNPKRGYKEHYHPSMHNPNWGPEMESEFKAQLSEQGYIHEILAEFGTQDTGVFNKDKLDLAISKDCYVYSKLLYEQERRIKEENLKPTNYLFDENYKPPINPFRTMGVDWDKYSASSSILILDYDVNWNNFRVIKRIEVPRGEYSYDNAVNMIVELNDLYNPSWIYCDRGAGEYQIERLHIIGDGNPSSNLKNKVKGWQFKNSIEIIDPVTKDVNKEPLKPFMVNQLQILFDREKVILSPFDEVLHKQLIDYEVEREGVSGPVFTSVNEHFVDALGLAYLAFVLEFPQLTNTIKNIEFSSKVLTSRKQLGGAGVNQMFKDIELGYSQLGKDFQSLLKYDPTELPGDRPSMVKVPLNYSTHKSSKTWGSRSGRRGFSGRSMW